MRLNKTLLYFINVCLLSGYLDEEEICRNCMCGYGNRVELLRSSSLQECLNYCKTNYPCEVVEYWATGMCRKCKDISLQTEYTDELPHNPVSLYKLSGSNIMCY